MASRAREVGPRVRERSGSGTAAAPPRSPSRRQAAATPRASVTTQGIRRASTAGKRPNAYPTPSSGSGPGSRRRRVHRRVCVTVDRELERGLDLEVGVLPRRGLEVQASSMTRETVSPRDHALRRPAPDPALWGPGGGLADKESTTPRAPVLGAGRSTQRGGVPSRIRQRRLVQSLHRRDLDIAIATGP